MLPHKNDGILNFSGKKSLCLAMNWLEFCPKLCLNFDTFWSLSFFGGKPSKINRDVISQVRRSPRNPPSVVTAAIKEANFNFGSTTTPGTSKPFTFTAKPPLSNLTNRKPESAKKPENPAKRHSGSRLNLPGILNGCTLGPYPFPAASALLSLANEGCPPRHIRAHDGPPAISPDLK